jgi:hypothetical protein
MFVNKDGFKTMVDDDGNTIYFQCVNDECNSQNIAMQYKEFRDSGQGFACRECGKVAYRLED